MTIAYGLKMHSYVAESREVHFMQRIQPDKFQQIVEQQGSGRRIAIAGVVNLGRGVKLGSDHHDHHYNRDTWRIVAARSEAATCRQVSGYDCSQAIFLVLVSDDGCVVLQDLAAGLNCG